MHQARIGKIDNVLQKYLFFNCNIPSIICVIILITIPLKLRTVKMFVLAIAVSLVSFVVVAQNGVSSNSRSIILRNVG